MKRLVRSLALVLALCVTISVSALAYEPDDETTDRNTGASGGETGTEQSTDAASAGKASTGDTGTLTTWVDADGAEVARDTEGAKAYETSNFGQIGSFSDGGDGDYDYRTALYYDTEGLNEAKSVTAAAVGGEVGDTDVSGAVISAMTPGFSGVIAVGNGKAGSAKLNITDATISAKTDSDGSEVSDFTGLGTAVCAFKGATVTVDNSTIGTSGVAKAGLLADDQAAILAIDSYINTQGGTLYDGYRSTADKAVMVSPHWVLGIRGSSRSCNVEGQSALIALDRSEVVSTSWGILSAETGKNGVLFALDSTLSLDDSDTANAKDPFIADTPANGMTENYGSGYGSSGDGGSRQWFLGCVINVGTYAACLSDGSVTYGASNGMFDVCAADQSAEPEKFLGTDVAGLAAEPTFTGLKGEGNATTINSDGFGFLCHGPSKIYVTDGTVVNSDEAAFLIKASGAHITVDKNSKLNPANGILFQMMDNDAVAVGMDRSQGTGVFNASYGENAGWPSANGTAAGAASPKYDYFTLEGTEASGNIYNGTGYSCCADALDVTLGKGAILNGAIASTETIHANENYDTSMTAAEALTCQNTSFTSDQYYYMGRVANRVYFNGSNTVDVTLTDDAVWNVTGVSVIKSLSVAPTAAVNGKVYRHDGFIVVVPTGEADPYEGLSATPAYAKGESTDFSAVASGSETASGKNVSVTVNIDCSGLKTINIGTGSDSANAMDIGELLKDLGAKVSYDEKTGDTTVTFRNSEALSALLGLDSGTSGTAGDQDSTSQPATQKKFDAYVEYLRGYMADYSGLNSGSFDDSVRKMALDELDNVAYGDDVSAFPFEMYVDVFGAESYADWYKGSTAAGAAGSAAVSSAGGDTSEAAYQNYLRAFAAHCDSALVGSHAQQFYDAINAGDYTDFPVDMLFDADWVGTPAMTYVQFVAADGAYDFG
jgi:hypothetical protein